MTDKLRGSYDFECDDWTKPVCCGLLWGEDKDNREWLFIEGKDSARNALLTMLTIAKSDNVWIWYAHNGGKYDALFMLAVADSMRWECKAIISGGRIIQLKTRPKGEKKWLQLNDSMSIIQSSLEDAANSFQLKSRKLFTKEDYSTNPSTWTRERRENGCRVDCQIVLELLDTVETLVHIWGGGLKLTFSAIALSVVKSRVELAKVGVKQNMTARDAYMGGRVEVFHHSPDYEMSEWDVTSSYPWSMTQPLPWEFEKRVIGNVEKYVYESSSIVFARVSVDPKTYIPSLPYRHADGGIFFPTGTWESWFTSAELAYAASMGVKVSPLIADVYSTAQPFKQFVTDVFHTKSTTEGAQREFSKLVLNGAYGKFAQRPERETVEIFATDEEAYAAYMNAPVNTLRPLSDFTPRYVSRKTVKWPYQTHYALASFITAHSRILLHKALVAAKGLAYTDTDSVHASVDSKFSVGGKLGQLKLSIPSMKGEYFAAKLYRLTLPDKQKFKSKGFEVKEDVFGRIIQGQSVATPRMQLAKQMLRSENRRGMQVKRPSPSRKWKGMSMKRAVHDNGDTRPWTVNELRNGEHYNSRSFHQVALQSHGASTRSRRKRSSRTKR